MATLIAAARETIIACICRDTCGWQVSEQGDIWWASAVKTAQVCYSPRSVKL
jgi:hypothetical protein